MSELIATIDVGTNTAHLLVSLVTDGGEALPMQSITRFVRLGQGVDATGEIHPDALGRLRNVLREFASAAEQAGVATVLAAGTSASRDSKRPDDLVRFVKHETGLDYEILSGEQEAFLTALGAMSSVDRGDCEAVIADIGGGSTELTYVTRRGGSLSIDRAVSLDIGSVRITERYFSHLPPSDQEAARARAMVGDALAEAARPLPPGVLFVGAAGTIRALALVDSRTPSAAVNGDEIVSRARCRYWCNRLLAMDLDSTLALHPEALHGRADVFAAGVMILDHTFDVLEAEKCIVSPRGLRHGMAIRYAALKNMREA